MSGPRRDAVTAIEGGAAGAGLIGSVCVAQAGGGFGWSMAFLAVALLVGNGAVSGLWGWWSGRASRAREEVER